MKPPDPALDTALRQFEERERLFRAEALAEPDPGLQSYRVLKWLSKRIGVKLGDVEVLRFPSNAAPGLNGFRWKGSYRIYLADSAPPRTVIHEGLHVLKPGLCEYSVLKLSALLDRELGQLWHVPVPSSPPVTEVERNIEWVY